MSDIDLDSQRRELARAMLDHVPFDGWSWAALHAAAEDLGLDKVDAANAFPEGPDGTIAVFSTEADYAMLVALEEYDLESMRTRDRIHTAIRVRLEQNEQHQEAIRRALSVLAMPGNAALATRLLYRTVDAVWNAAGDASIDINFYSKRALLAGVYSATLLYWLEDRSEGHSATWTFLEQRLDNVVRIGGEFGKRVKQVTEIPRRIGRMLPDIPRRQREFADMAR
jgi:ubiquinone biosynthesis protein COQ9